LDRDGFPEEEEIRNSEKMRSHVVRREAESASELGSARQSD
jgi:hypothetical protein